MTVFAYFADVLGRNPKDSTLLDLPLSSGCGADCKRAIDHAAALLTELRAALGTSGPAATIAATIVDAVEHIVSVYWRG